MTPPSTNEGSTQTGLIVTTASVVRLLEDPLVFTASASGVHASRHYVGYLQPPADGGVHHSDKG